MALQPPTNPHITEKTFTAYTPTQATTYATTRLNYHPSVYNHILSHHTSTSGKLDTHLDIGCGPGPATRSLSSHFTHSIGIDPSPALLDVAKSLTPDGSSITYHESTASTFTPDPINPASVDLITVANAAHWFPHMHAFYRHAAVALRPGGTLAIWGGGNLSPDPTLENAAKIKDVIDAFIEGDVREYVTEGNLMVHNAYAGLKMPWDNDGGKAVRGFDREGYSRKEWGAEDKFHEMRNGEEEAEGLTLPMLEKVSVLPLMCSKLLTLAG